MTSVWQGLSTVWNNISILNFPSGGAAGTFLIILFISLSVALALNNKGKSMVWTSIIFLFLMNLLGFITPVVLLVFAIIMVFGIGDDVMEEINKGFFKKKM